MKEKLPTWFHAATVNKTDYKLSSLRVAAVQTPKTEEAVREYGGEEEKKTDSQLERVSILINKIQF